MNSRRVVTDAQVLTALQAYEEQLGGAITLQPFHVRLLAMRAALEAVYNQGEVHELQRVTAG